MSDKVYLVWAGEYDLTRVAHVCKDKSVADSLAAKITEEEGYFKDGQLVADGGYVVEYELE